jgi:hypothetical protein
MHKKAGPSLQQCGSLSIQFNSIQGALLAWETYVNIAKANEMGKQK